MKQQSNVKVKFRTKLLIVITCLCLVPMLISNTISYITSQSLLKDKLETTSKQTVNEITRGIDNYFNSMSNLLKVLVKSEFVSGVDNKENLNSATELMSSIHGSDENIINVFAGSDKGVFVVEPHVVLPDTFDHRDTSWYKNAQAAPDTVIFTNPYIDTATGKMVITLSSTISYNNQVIGVAGIDVDLEALSQDLSSIKVGDEGYVFITDQTGILVTHPDPTLIGSDLVTKISLWDKANHLKEGFDTYEMDGDEKFVVFNTSEYTHWKVVASLNFEELQHDTELLKSTLIIGFAITAFLSVLVSILFSIPVNKNITSILNALDSFAHGNLKTKVSIQSKDEFQQLSNHFNEMSDHISSLVNNVSDASITVLDTSIILSNVAEETNASISEVARAVDEVTKGATEQAQASSDGASSIVELAKELSQIQESADTMNDLSQSTNKLTLHGLEQIKTLAQKSEETLNSTNTVSKLVHETSESMMQIAAISNTINNITTQTNLLALNASIEAARAGESGKGFAVVADEIRKLADQSKASTAKIKEIVAELNDKTEDSVIAMEMTNANMTEQTSLVMNTQQIFTEIMNSVSMLSHRITDIKEHIVEISIQKETIVDQIENVSAISEEAASATEEVTASTEQITYTMDDITKHANELKELSERLQDRLNELKF